MISIAKELRIITNLDEAVEACNASDEPIGIEAYDFVKEILPKIADIANWITIIACPSAERDMCIQLSDDEAMEAIKHLAETIKVVGMNEVDYIKAYYDSCKPSDNDRFDKDEVIDVDDE